MNKYFLLLFLMVGFAACANSEQPTHTLQPDPEKPKGRAIKVLSYNIHHSNPPSRPDFIDLEAIAKVIKESKAEIVGLQEVDVFTSRSGSDLHMAKSLAEMTEMPYFYFSKGIDYEGGEYGTAILSKYPLTDTKTILLPAEEGTEQRTISVATVNLEKGLRYQFANTHLDFSSERNALSQAEMIVQYFAEETMPVILVGDFNSTPDSAPISTLDGSFTRTCRNDCAPTIPVINPKKTIDFIMYRRSGDFTVRNHRVIKESYASDHLPVLAELILLK
ncbi:endonuclease/exonuclease/phosphatase family metal-dependent hydrolase [Algoriphagus sp. 4150]|uniref:endonuclease/exonuclease/phosphatase family protein n=1 Tax=Algoriphagus sp. 4150 TaxID=2817756 RepID=UPI00286087E1|nr:endonuclease/exonuclease/phosphatase family protein [Algoriphagus sp. 4150]MDR7128129.1 endonuclease/exonuclease/phosphatase family metal-dependent hydrolase [Algoriphagus sp. 4150]